MSNRPDPPAASVTTPSEPRPKPGQSRRSASDLVADYRLLEALQSRRSRRFATGMKVEKGPLAFSSARSPFPLDEKEEAALVYAACGITGYAAADLVYEAGQGGAMMAGLVGRTVGSPDAVQGVALAVTNDEATYLIRRPHDFPAHEISQLLELARAADFVELYRRTRVKISDGRSAPPAAPPHNIDCNRWDMYAPGTTYFLPINDLTFLYINVLLEAFTPTMGLFVVDERAGFRPAGLKKFGKSRGGHLFDDPAAERILTVERFEATLQSVLLIEQGMMLQNLGLMSQAMGLGGFPNFAGHEFAWFEALDFRMRQTSALRYAGASRLIRLLGGLFGKDRPLQFPVGLERGGETLLKSYCPPYYPSMEDAVLAAVERKFGPRGLFGEGVKSSAWRDPEAVGKSAPRPSDANVGAVIAYCSYLLDRYGRFPSYPAPFRTSVGFQAGHLDLDFYDRYYRPEVLSAAQREHMSKWHEDPGKRPDRE